MKTKEILYNNYNKLTSTEKYILKYILNNLNEVKDFSIEKLSEKTFTSKSSIVSFCKKIDLSGYRELHQLIILWSKEKEEQIANLSNPFEFVINKKKNEIESIFKLNGEENFKKAIKIIDDSEIIFLYGLGESKKILKMLDYKFNSVISKNCILVDDVNQFDFLLKKTTHKEKISLIAVSISGTTEHTITIIKKAKAHSGKIISITNAKLSPIVKISDVILKTNIIKEEYNNGINLSIRSSHMIILEIILNMIEIRNQMN